MTAAASSEAAGVADLREDLDRVRLRNFIIDAFNRRIVGWQITYHLGTDLALDALEIAIWQRHDRLDGLVHHSDRGAHISPSATPNGSPTPAP